MGSEIAICVGVFLGVAGSSVLWYCAGAIKAKALAQEMAEPVAQARAQKLLEAWRREELKKLCDWAEVGTDSPMSRILECAEKKFKAAKKAAENEAFALECQAEQRGYRVGRRDAEASYIIEQKNWTALRGQVDAALRARDAARELVLKMVQGEPVTMADFGDLVGMLPSAGSPQHGEEGAQ